MQNLGEMYRRSQARGGVVVGWRGTIPISDEPPCERMY